MNTGLLTALRFQPLPRHEWPGESRRAVEETESVLMDRHSPPRTEPHPLGEVLSQLFALRGYGRVRGERRLQEVWREIAGETIARQTRVLGVNGGVLHVGVASAALLSELAAFHKHSLLARLQSVHPQLQVRDLKFKLRGDLGSPGGC